MYCQRTDGALLTRWPRMAHDLTSIANQTIALLRSPARHSRQAALDTFQVVATARPQVRRILAR